MKKCLALLVCIGLLLYSPWVLAAEYTAEELFTITYDESRFQLDDFTFLDDCTPSREWLFMLYSDDAVVDAALLKLQDGLTLDTQEQQQAYVADMLDSYADQDAVYLLTLSCGPQSIPFFLFQLQDEEGAYLLAEAVIDGWGYDFSAYYEDSQRKPDGDLTSWLIQILRTFEPVEDKA